MKIKCKKDLVNDCGHKDFSKGKVYETNSYEINENTKVISDDEGMPHTLGTWYKHFKKE